MGFNPQSSTPSIWNRKPIRSIFTQAAGNRTPEREKKINGTKQKCQMNVKSCRKPQGFWRVSLWKHEPQEGGVRPWNLLLLSEYKGDFYLQQRQYIIVSSRGLILHNLHCLQTLFNLYSLEMVISSETVDSTELNHDQLIFLHLFSDDSIKDLVYTHKLTSQEFMAEISLSWRLEVDGWTRLMRKRDNKQPPR